MVEHADGNSFKLMGNVSGHGQNLLIWPWKNVVNFRKTLKCLHLEMVVKISLTYIRDVPIEPLKY